MAAHNRPLSGMFGQPNFFRSAVFSAILQVRIAKLVLQKMSANAGFSVILLIRGFTESIKKLNHLPDMLRERLMGQFLRFSI